MYLPNQFREDREKVLHETMRRIGAAILVSQGPHGMTASHVPIELDTTPGDTGPHGTLRCHLAKPNPQVSAFVQGQELLVIFQGSQGYISPNWYPSKHQTGKVLPTWNYVAIHAYGTATTFEEQDKLLAHLEALTGHFESDFNLPWKVADAPKDYIDSMRKAIIGVDIQITRLEGKWKMSQNKSEHDVTGVINGLRAKGDEVMADVIEQVRNQT